MTYATLRLLVTVLGLAAFLIAVLVVIVFLWAFLTPMSG